MKLKELLYGLRLKPTPVRYGYEIVEGELEPYGEVRFARWLHPCNRVTFVWRGWTKWVRRFVRRGDFCIDVGAFIGDTTVPMGLAAGAEGLVLALEPNPYVFHVLTRNALLNPELMRIEPLMAAAGDSDGTAVFHYSDPGYCNGGGHHGISRWTHGHMFELEVETVNLSSLLKTRYAGWLPRLSYVKIDAEGNDLLVLRGLKDTLREVGPVVEFEIFRHSDRTYREEAYAMLRSLDYRLYRVEDRTTELSQPPSVTPIEEADAMLEAEHFDVLCVPRGKRLEDAIVT